MEYMSTGSMDFSVLVVEDSKVTMAALCKYLGKIGVQQLFTAMTGQDALDLFRRNRPDIILLDGLLPDIDGFDVAKQMREIEAGKSWSAIIFLTGMDNDEDLARGIEAGGDDYLTKPITSIVLKAKINALQRLIRIQRANLDLTRQLNEAKRLLHEANKKLQVLSPIDESTGVSNRRTFDEFLQNEWQRCKRLKMPLSLVMMDLDYFKQYNAAYGQQTGDECLKSVAAQVARSIGRPSDLVARFGGEEFAMILGLTDMDGARHIAERTRKFVADLKIKHEASTLQHVTISCGVSSLIPDDQCAAEDLVKAANEALSQAKSQGRNTVVCSKSRFLDDFHAIINS
jgi:diguanylate cyclase (GGDEF)-like protein